MIEEQLKKVQDEIAEAALRAGRKPETVKLVAVSKTVPVERVNEAIAQGASIIGENKVQELLLKLDALLPVEKHLIGHLQSNKAAAVVDHVSLIHSLDRWSLAQRLNQLGKERNKRIAALVQVNIGCEDSKSGLEPGALFDFLDQIQELEHLEIKGLMCIPPFVPKEEARRFFAQTRALAEQAASKGYEGMSFSELSMGMSHDFEEAIFEGASFVRVGTAIFGERKYPLA